MNHKLSPIFSNTLAQLLAKAVAVLLTLLSTFYFLRLGGLKLFGQYSQALAIITIAFTLTDFGLNAHTVREMTGPIIIHRHLFSINLFSRLFLSILAFLGANLVVQLLPGGYSGELRGIFWLGSLTILFQGFYASGNAWFQRRLSYWRGTIAVLAGTIFGTVLTLFFLFTSPTLGRILLATSAGYLVMGVLALFLTGQLARLRPLPSLGELKTHLRGSFYLGLILVFSTLASKLDTVILGIFRPAPEVGEYAFAYRLFDVALVLPAFVMNSVYPLLIGATHSVKTTLISRSIFSLTCLGVLGVVLLYPLAPLILLVRPELTLSLTVFRLLIFSLPLFFATSPLMWSLVESRHERSLLVVYLLAALINTSLNLMFIPRFGALAAALTTGITELYIFFSLLYIKRRL